MGLFIKTQEFKNLNVGCALDEGMASATDEFMLYYGERSIWGKCSPVVFDRYCNLKSLWDLTMRLHELNFLSEVLQALLY